MEVLREPVVSGLATGSCRRYRLVVRGHWLTIIQGDTYVRVLQDRSKIRAVVSRGRRVDLDRTWPSKRRLPGEKVSNWADQILTYEVAMSEGNRH